MDLLHEYEKVSDKNSESRMQRDELPIHPNEFDFYDCRFLIAIKSSLLYEIYE